MSRSAYVAIGWGAVLITSIALTTRSNAQPLPDGTPVAVIVHPNNPLRSITLEDLRRLFTGARSEFPNRQHVTLLVSPSSRTRFYQSTLGMDVYQVARIWIGVVFKGGDATPPKEVIDVAELLLQVGQDPGALAFVDAALVTPGVRVLTVEGLDPSDPSYPIR